MEPIKIDWAEVFFVSPSSALHAAAIRAGPAAARQARFEAWPPAEAGKEGVARASSGDEQKRGAQALHLRLEALCSELERRVSELGAPERSPVTRAAAKAAADPGQDAHSTAENAHNLNQENGKGEQVAYKSCLKSSPVLVRRKKNHEQGHGDCKRVARPAANKDDDGKEPAPPEEIFEVLREIPSLDRADVLRAYSMLIRDDRLFRSLMALPKDMRKDWLLMEIGNQ